MPETNRAIVFDSPTKLTLESLDFPKLQMPDGTKAPHGVICLLYTSDAADE